MSEIVGRYVVVGGHRLYYEAIGEGQPVVCIHSAGHTALQWRFALPHFSERGYRAIALDLPGHGKSLLHNWKAINSIHGFAELVWNFSEAIGLQYPTFIGCSIGANIALDLGVHHASQISALVVCDGAARTSTVPERIIRFGLEDSGTPSSSDQAYYGTIGATGNRAESERVEELAWLARQRDPTLYANDMLAWTRHDVRGDLGRVTCPVLLIRGRDDFIVPLGLVEETRAGLERSEFVELPGIGHFLHVETNDVFAAIDTFFARYSV
jgi:pimeloyl-ACP methyl ester carboxylesterase